MSKMYSLSFLFFLFFFLTRQYVKFCSRSSNAFLNFSLREPLVGPTVATNCTLELRSFCKWQQFHTMFQMVFSLSQTEGLTLGHQWRLMTPGQSCLADAQS